MCAGESRAIVLDSNFFTGYRRTVIAPGELLVSILIPFTQEVCVCDTCVMCVMCAPHTQNEYILSYKQSRRREDDIAIVNAGLRVKLVKEESDWTVKDCCLSYGGMSYVTTVARKTQDYLIGK